MKISHWILWVWLSGSAGIAHAQSYNYFAPGGAISCTGPCTQQSIDLSANSFLLNTLANSKLTNSSFTLNGLSLSLGGTRTLLLASSDFVNQGTTTTVLHGNAAGNPSFGAVNLATEVTGTLPQGNLLTCAANQIVFDNASALLTCSASFLWTNTTQIMTLGSLATPATLTTPAGSASAGAPLTISTGAGVGTNQLGGAINIIPGRNSSTLNTTGAAVNISAGSSSAGVVSGDVTVTANNIVLNARGFLGSTQLKIAGSGDLLFSTAVGDPIFFYQALDTVAGDFAEIQVIDSASNGTTIGTLTAGSNCQLFYGAVVPTTECSFYDTSTGKAVIYAVGGVPYEFIDINGNYSVPAPAVPFAVGDTNGFEYIQTVAGIPTGVPAQLTGVYANGTPLRYDITNNRLDVYNNGWKQIQAGNLVLSGTTGSIGGGALLAGTCTSGTVAITGTTTAMAVVATPVTYPGDGTDWKGYISSAGTATVKVCALVAVTPTATAYNVRVLQ